MANCKIILEDLGGGKVKVVSEPSMEIVFKMVESGNELTAAHGYLFVALNAIRKAAQSKEPTNKILIPRVGRL